MTESRNHMRELFIYYRILAADRHSATAAVLGFQARLRECYPQLVTRLLYRPEAIDGLLTWMETYATDPRQDPAGVSPHLQATIEEYAVVLTPLIHGNRHTEVFTVCAA